MNMTRQDAWSRDEDVILAETVLRYIRMGKTQLEAFEEVAAKLSRTSAACGFRWNATIRRQYDDAVQQAKQDRKAGLTKENSSDNANPSSYNKDPIEAAIVLLQKMQHGIQSQDDLEEDEAYILIDQLQKENESLKENLNRYDAAWNEMGKLWEWVRSDKQVTDSYE